MIGEKYYHNRRTRSEHAFFFNETREILAVEDPSFRLTLVKAHGQYRLTDCVTFWRRGVVVSVARRMNEVTLYVGSGPVSTRMGDRLWAGRPIPSRYVTSQL